MTKRWLLVIPALLCASCASLDLPTIEESQMKIETDRPRIEAADARIRQWSSSRLPGGSDIVTRIRMGAINRLLGAVAGQRSDDVRLRFLPTPGIVREEKDVFGIAYTNTLDIDEGDVSMNLKTLRFDRFEKNTAEATIEIEGEGRIAASGRYTGLPARATPKIALYLRDRIVFDIRPADSGMVVIAARAKTVILRATLSVTLLQWSVPWSQDIPLQIRDLLPPILVPVALSTEVPFPVPASKTGDDSFEYVPYHLLLSRSSVRTMHEILEVSTDIDFRRKDQGTGK